MAKAKETINGRLSLYSAKVNGLTGDVYILADTMKEALKIFMVDGNEPKDIRLIQEKIQIMGVK